MAKRIAVLSDTHGLLRPEVLTAIDGCDVIIHGGDINKPEIIDRLQEIAPVYVVRGNNDKEWAEHRPYQVRFPPTIYSAPNRRTPHCGHYTIQQYRCIAGFPTLLCHFIMWL